MKIAILSDAHGNINYLQACLSKIQEYPVKKYVFLGDAIGYMPYGNTVIETLDHLNAQCLLGNHEAMLCAYLPVDEKKDKVCQINETSKFLEPRWKNKISFWLPFYAEQLDGLNILYVHGSPWDPLQGYLYSNSPFLESEISCLPYDFVFAGHTHRPFISKNVHTTLVNAGSCGLPRDIGNRPSFVIFDTDTKDVQIIRITMDEQRVLDDLKTKGVHNSVIECLMRK